MGGRRAAAHGAARLRTAAVTLPCWPGPCSGTVVVVLVWINGPFGGGKTATAFELQRRLPGSIVCDPEHLGFGLRRMLPAALRTDFQGRPCWRFGLREVLDLAAPHR